MDTAFGTDAGCDGGNEDFEAGTGITEVDFVSDVFDVEGGIGIDNMVDSALGTAVLDAAAFPCVEGG